MKCLRCGQETPRFTPDQRHCIRCAAEVAELVAPRRDGFVAPWRRRLTAKDMTNYGPSL